MSTTSATRMGLSLIIPTVGRIEVLWNTIRLLIPQLQGEDEILLVDQNHPALHLPDDLSSFSIRLIRLEKPSLTRARNLGLDRALNDAVIFLDDDIEPWENLLEAFAKAASSHPGTILTGVVEQEDRGKDIDGVGFVDLDSGEIRTDYTRPISGEIPFFPGGLALMRKSDLNGLRFNPWFRGAAQGEEIDFALRAEKTGLRILSDPTIGMRHLKAPLGGCRTDTFRARFFLDEIWNRSLFYGRHGNWLRIGKFLGRVRGFVEFHSRKPEGGHSTESVGWVLLGMISGFIIGASLRLRIAFFRGNTFSRRT